MDRHEFMSIRDLSDDEVVLKVLNDFKQATADKKEDFARCRRYLNIYLALDNPDDIAAATTNSTEPGEDDTRYSNTHMPIGAAIADTAQTQIMGMLFPSPRYFKIDGDNFEDDLFAELVTAHQMKRHGEMKFKATVRRALNTCICFDYAVTFTSWKMTPGYVRKRKTTQSVRQYGKLKIPHQEVTMETEWRPDAVDRPHFERFDFFHCAHDKNATNGNGFEDSEFFIDWYDITVEDLVAQAETEQNWWGQYKNVEKVLQKHMDLGGSWGKGQEEDPHTRRNKPAKNIVTVVRYWTKHQVVQVAHEEVISRTDLTGWPLQKWVCYEVPGRFHGMGALQRIERNVYDINAIINNKRDMQNMTLTPISVIDRSLVGLDEGDPELYPGRAFVSRSGDVTKKLWFYQPGADMSQAASEEVRLQIDMVKQVTGFDDNAMAAYTPGRKTARETSAVMMGLLVKVKQMAERLQEDCLEPAYMDFFMLDQMYLTGEDAFKYMGADGASRFFKIIPAYYAWNNQPKFTAVGASHFMEDDMMKAQYFKAVELAMALPQYHNMRNILAKLWQILDPKDHTDMMNDPRDRGENVPPDIENFLFAQGQTVRVSPENDSAEHLSSHERQERSPDFKTWPTGQQEAFKGHIQDHQRQGAAQAQPPPQVSLGQQDQSDLARGQRSGQLTQEVA